MSSENTPAKIGNWYHREPLSQLRNASRVFLIHVLSEEVRNVGDPLPGKVRHMRQFYNCMQYQIISDKEGIFLSISNKKFQASEFTDRRSQFSPAKESQFKHWMKLLMGGRPVIEAAYD
jgi:hypothetical protein